MSDFFEFYSRHYFSFTVVILVTVISIIGFLYFMIKKVTKSNKIKTPWFEIAPDSIKVPESEEAGKTRLLLKRQSDYLNLFLNNMQPTFSAITKEIVEESLKILFNNEVGCKTHMQTCLIQSATSDIIEQLKNYWTNLIVVNHIGTDKDKITHYAKGHVIPTLSIIKNAYCDLFCKLSGQVCIDISPYLTKVGITNQNEWIEQQLISLLMSLAELRYSDFNQE